MSSSIIIFHFNPMSNVNVYDKLFVKLPFFVGNNLSKADKEELLGASVDIRAVPSLTYGETPYETTKYILERALKDKDVDSGMFVDVGSGTGKVVFAAALLGLSFKKYIGVEILPSLVDESKKVLELWKDGVPLEQGDSSTNLISPKMQKMKIEFILGDACQEGVLKWKNVSVAYACSTLFDEKTMSKLGKRARKMSAGSLFICTCNTLPGVETGEWRIIDSFPVDMSWGAASAYVHQRLKHDD